MDYSSNCAVITIFSIVARIPRKTIRKQQTIQSSQYPTSRFPFDFPLLGILIGTLSAGQKKVTMLMLKARTRSGSNNLLY